jgi:hypothetical protein
MLELTLYCTMLELTLYCSVKQVNSSHKCNSLEFTVWRSRAGRNKIKRRFLLSFYYGVSVLIMFTPHAFVT